MSSKPLAVKQLPLDVSEWRNLATAWDATGGISELGSPVKVQSASSFEFNHFLGLQVLYVFPKNGSTLPIEITEQFPPEPTRRLETLSGYTAYLNEIESFRKEGTTRDTIAQTFVPRRLGALVSVWQFQRHVLVGDDNAADLSKISEVSPVADRTRAKIKARHPHQTPTPAPKFKNMSLVDQAAKLSLKDDDEFGSDEARESSTDSEDEVAEDEAAEHSGSSSDDDGQTELEGGNADEDPNDASYTPARGPGGRLIRDEQTVNVFLLALLSAITATTVPFDTRWLAERNAMVFKKNVRYIARTDGHLRNRKGQSFSLIEVKPRMRRDDVSIRVQESAQMAAWISQNKIKSHDPGQKCEMFLLSQDKDEIYLTFPHFTEDYGKPYKEIRYLREKHFLRMHEYGPFRLTSKADVNHVAEFLHNYTLHKSRQ